MARQHYKRKRITGGGYRNGFGHWRNLAKGVRTAWKHRKAIGNAAKSTANFLKPYFRKRIPLGDTYSGYGKARVGGQRAFRQSLQGTSQHNDTSTRFFKYTVRKGRKKGNSMRKKHHFKYGEEWNVILTTDEGYQNAADLRSIGTKEQLVGSPVVGTRALFYSTAASYYELNPYRINTGSTIFPAGTVGTSWANDKIYYRSVNGTLKVVNLESLATYIQIYWCKCKKSTGESPVTTWRNSATTERMGSTPSAPQDQTTDATAVAGYTTERMIGNHPNMYKAFRDYWQIVHSEKTYLQGGDQVDFKFHFNINKLLHRDTYSREPGLFVANMSIVPIIIQYGALAGISDVVAATAATEVVHGATKTGIAIIQNHEFGPVPSEARVPTGQFFPGMVHGSDTGPNAHVVKEAQIDDTDERDPIKVV